MKIIRPVFVILKVTMDQGKTSYIIRRKRGGDFVKFLIHAFFIILLLLVTFFGLGPVLYADGVIQERIWTAAVVVVLYALLSFLYSRAIKWLKSK
jgi:putative flippase GtrA